MPQWRTATDRVGCASAPVRGLAAGELPTLSECPANNKSSDRESYQRSEDEDQGHVIVSDGSE
jgi:hypothetical protein